MTTHGHPRGTDELRDEIEHTRAELGDTLSELSSRLDVKAQAKARVHHATEAAGDAVARAKAHTPTPVQHALDRAGDTIGRAGRQARPYRRQILAGVAGTAVLLWLVRRIRRD